MAETIAQKQKRFQKLMNDEMRELYIKSKSGLEKEKFDHLQMERQLNRDNFSKELEDTWKELEKVIKNIIESMPILIDKKLDLFSSTVNNK